MNNFKIKATVITPVSIGSGIQLSPYKDYFISNNKVHYVDEKKLSELLLSKENLMDQYVEGVANMDGNRSRFDLKDFIEHRISVDPFEVVRESVSFNGDANAKLPINGLIKMPNGQPYIPGSSIKGALKTALVYTDLQKTDFGKRWKVDFFKQLENINFNRRVTERGLQQRLKEQLNALEGKLKSKAEISNHSKVFQRLSVLDSTNKDNQNITVMDLKRTDITVRQEVLQVNAVFHFDVNSPIDNWSLFQEKINRFASNNLRYFEDHEKEKERIYNMVEDSFENNTDEAFLPLGFGKGIYLNSILESLKDYAFDKGKEQVFENYLSVLYHNSRNLNIDTFPVTEFKSFNESQPLGWIKLEKIN